MPTPVVAYRTLLRSVRTAFANDYAAITAATSQIREGFRESAAVTDLSQIASMCDEALDAAEFMKANVAQARLTDRGTYHMKIDERHGAIVADTPTLDDLPPSQRS